MKRFISLFCLFLAISMLPVWVWAEELEFINDSQQNCIIVCSSQAEHEAFLAQETENIISDMENADTKGPKYKYKVEYLPKQYKTLSGYAGNQVAGGYQFPTGGGFWFTDNGGPSVSGSINLSLPAPFNSLSFSINLGQKGSSGLFVTAPDTTHYFKLYVSKVMEITPYVIYRKRVGAEHDSDPWEIDSASVLQSVYSVSASARIVN